MVKLSSQAGTAGLPTGVKAQGQTVDFRTEQFIIAIESKGYRLAWKRAAYCPCVGDNEQTEQSSVNCSICEGSGWLMFTPANVANSKQVGKLDALQTQIANNAGVIFGIMTGLTGKENPYDQVQRRLQGQMNLTVRAENKIGYWDQFVNLDTTIVYSQWAKADGTSVTRARYPIVCMNLLRDESTVFVEGTDYQITGGNIQWIGSIPADGTRIAMHYLTYPHWRVTEHPHTTRATLVGAKTKNPGTPLGDPTELPVQAICQLEFLTSS